METAPAAVYESRNPRASSLYALVEDYYEEFERVYDERYPQQYGPWRKVIGEVMHKYLECGDLHRGFARLACGGCRYQTILAYSCKCRLFCPSCQQKRVLLFAEWLDTHILEQVSHAQYVFTIPKLLRSIFKYHPKKLGLLCKSAWQALREMFQEVALDPSALPGVVISVQSYGDHLNLHPHVHALASRGVWSADPLVCPRCGAQLRIISFIDNPSVIEKILRHLNLWHPPERPPPPRRSRTLEPDADFLAWEAVGRLFDGID